MSWQPIPSFTAPHYLDTNLNQIQKCIGWYTEKTPGGDILVSEPGYAILGTTANNAGCRGVINSKYQTYSVHGTKVYAINSGVPTELTVTLTASAGFIGWAENNSNQILFVDGYYGYIINVLTNAITKITDANFPASPVDCAYNSGRFIVVCNSSAIWYASALEDGLTWTPLVFGTAESISDNINAVVSMHGGLYFIGFRSIEFWIPQDSNPYFQPVTGTVQRLGVGTSRFYGSPATIGDNIYAILISENKTAGLYRIGRGGSEMLSPPSINSILSKYGGDTHLSGYVNDGHEVVEIKAFGSFGGGFPNAMRYDVSTNTWAEINTVARPILVISNFQLTEIVGGYVLMFDNGNGKIYGMGSSYNKYNSYNGAAITRVLDFKLDGGISRTVNQGLRFELEIQHDSSSSYTLSATLQKSDDAGLTFDTGITISKAITSGTTAQQVILQTPPLGSFKAGRIYRLTFTGPSARIILRRAEGLVRVGRF